MVASQSDRKENTGLEGLAARLRGRVCIFGVGNRDRRDDGVGSRLAERLAGRSAALAIDAGAVPENYLQKAMKPRPDTILIVDAADFGAAPGEVRLLDPDSIEHAGLSTHAISLRMAATYFRQRVGAQVLLLAIQPADVGPGRELSAEVWRAVALIEAAVCSAVPGTSRAGTAQT